MARELIVSANVHEKKVAIIEDGVVTEFYVERRDENQGVVGNLYKGRVMKVLPGMQSAFVDIALERDAFLYVSDFAEFMEEEDEIDFRDAGGEDRGPRPERQQRGGQMRRGEGPPHAAGSRPQLVQDEPKPGPVQFEDVVEQLAEIADESVIPPPARDDELEDLSGSGGASQTSESDVIQNAEVTIVDTGLVEPAHIERITDDFEPSELPEVEVVSAEESGSDESEPVEEVEAPKGRGRSRRKPAAASEARKGARGRKKAAPAEETTSRSGRKTTSRKRGGKATEEQSTDTDAIASASQFERITDDGDPDKGELLKDAMVQEKIIEQVHQAEYRTASLEAPPEPEWRIGTYRGGAADSSFQRVEDETETAHSTTSFEPVEEPEKERSYAAHTAAAEGTGEQEEDREAELRDRGFRSEFAVRRGGRGRRRRRREPTGPEGEQAPGAQAAPGEDDGQRAPEAELAAVPEETVVATAVAEARTSEEAPREGNPRNQQPQQSRFERRPPRDQRRDFRPEQRRGDYQAPRRNDRIPPTISDLLHEGQEILVQIAKEPIAKKGARITSHIALPGRLLVYMPTVNHIGVSRKIPSDMERVRLKRTVTALRDRENASGGFIARTACAGHTEQELHDDMRYLIRTWNDVRKKAERVKAPSLVHRDLDLVQRILRDQLSEDFTAIRVDNEIEYARIVEFVNRVQPRLVKRAKLYTGNQPILEKYGIQAEIDKAVKPRVWLKSGGYIVINQTEALVAIDVNTGKFVGKSDRLEDTITRTNLEAAKEIVRQVRLRDLGGIIVIDFIDMEERKNRQKVMQALQQELGRDRAPSKILSINDFGLVAITRKRVKQSLERTMCAPCPYCQGAGMVKSAQTMCFEILEQAKSIAPEINSNNDVMLRVSPPVADALRSIEKEVMEEIEGYFGIPVTIEADPNLHQEQYDFAIL